MSLKRGITPKLGMLCFVLIVCQVLEAAHDETSSKSNKHEAELCVSLCRYLLQQGYPPNSVTVLTAYTGQVLAVKDIMSRDKDFYAGTVAIEKLCLETDL